jgi:murein DD-endopeptidase MepM/ murein hydrolase activator NlpD
MSRLNVPLYQRAFQPSWPLVAVMALAGVALGSCSDSGRFGYTNTSSRQAPPQEVTGSVTPRSAPSTRVVAQPLPAPSAPATVAANQGYSSGNGSASGAQGLGAYRPAAPTYSQPAAPTYTQSSEITGSVRPIAAPPKPSGEWTWDGGSPVTVGHGETAEQIARKHGVPLTALLQTNGITNAAAIRPGQRLVIPRYITHSAPQAAAAPARAPGNGNVHIVARGESLMSISRKHSVSVTALAQANNLQPSTRIAIGDRLTVPGGARQPVATRQTQYTAPAMAPAPQIAQPRSVPVAEQVATIPPQTARMATPEPAKAAEDPVKSAEPAGGMQTFRWPVKGRVIAGFGPKTSGGQNDGINLAVPEGTPVKAADDGVVAYAGNELKGYGNLVLIRHSNGFVSAYAHASELMVKRGDTIKRGQVIANAGQTGNVTSPQLHFEIRKGSTPVDPTKYLSGT